MAFNPPERSLLWKQAYPKDLMIREEAFLKLRPRDGKNASHHQRAKESSCERHAKVGVALSGGGIRSATFGFGVIQAWAERKDGGSEEREKLNSLAEIHVLSTVSGGGYTGSLLSRLFARDEVKNTDDVARAILPARESKDSKKGISPGAVLRWLRDNGRYLAPNGSGDLLLGGTIIVRNWLSIHVVLTTLALAVFAALQLVRNLLHHWNPEGLYPRSLTCGMGLTGVTSLAELEAWLNCHLPLGKTLLWWSPWVLLPVGILCLWAVPLAWAYWLAADRGRLPRVPQSLDPLWGWFFVLIVLLFFLASFSEVAPTTVGTMGGAVFVVGITTIAIFGYADALTLRDADNHSDDSKPRNWLSSKLKNALIWFGATLALAAIDTLGQTVYAVWQAPLASPSTWLGTLLGGLVAAAAGGRRVAAYFSGKPGGARIRPTLNHSATIAAVLLFTVTLTAINALTHGIAWGLKNPRYVPEKLVAPPVPGIEKSVDRNRAEMAELDSSVRNLAEPGGAISTPANLSNASPCPGSVPFKEPRVRCTDYAEWGERDYRGALAAFLFFVALSWLFGQTWSFLNNSTLLPLYTARLIRAYLGASNPERTDPRPVDGDTNRAARVTVTEVLEGDDMWIEKQWWSNDTPRRENDTRNNPFAKGAPLHLVNVTINESLDGKSRVQQNDRRGIGMAVGPAGISAGIRHHVVFPESADPTCKPPAIVFPKAPALDASDDDRRARRPFRMFDYSPARRGSDEPRERYDGKPLSLGQWAGISGAAFSTGLGSRTSLGLSFLAGFFNVRLGFWWDSGVDPKKRGSAKRKRPWLGEWFTWALPVQSYLLDEFFARFHGTARRWWYLSDGGHFENTGAYELIRRRLPLIVIIDAGADPDYTCEDLGNLVRKARIDFDAEIKFLDDKKLGKLTTLPEQERFGGFKHFGTLEMLRRTPRDEEPIPETKGAALVPRSLAHAALAVVKYENRNEPDSLIVYVKPTIVGDESPDITHYHADNQNFPQQTTSDQFFDEAQWESYRKLGQLITERVFPSGLGPYVTLLEEIMSLCDAESVE